jgi:hypothetical protein
MFTSGTQKLQGRAVGRVEDNPILAAYREYPEHTPDSASTWLATILDLNDGTTEIRELLVDSYGTPQGPGWEDTYWAWLQAARAHAAGVLRRFTRIYG